MKDVIATVQCKTWHARKMGFYSLFAFAHSLGAEMGVESVYAINNFGVNSDPDSFDLLKKTADLLDIEPREWWADEELEKAEIEAALQEMFECMASIIENREISRCICGNIEYLADAKLYGRKTLLDGGISKCCNSVVGRKSEEVLVTAPLPKVETPKVYPVWAQKELSVKLENMRGKKLLISRATERRFKIQVNDRLWNIDNDIMIWLYSKWLQKKGYNLKHLVVGVSTLHQAALITTVSNLLGIPPPEHIYCLPKVYFDPVHGVDTIEKAVYRFGKVRVVNALLRCASSRRKSITLSGSTFPSERDDKINQIRLQ